MNHTLKNKYFTQLLVLVLSLMADLTYAQSPSGYAEWKAMQQAQDQQLKTAKNAKKQNVQTPNSANYYLSRPTTDSKSSQDRVRLNSATAEQLQVLSGIGQKKAEAIVAYRQKNGLFKSIEDIQLVKGVGQALFTKNKARLAL